MKSDPELSLLRLQADVLDQCYIERNYLSDDLQHRYAHCRTVTDKLRFLQLQQRLLQRQLELNRAAHFSDLEQFCQDYQLSLQSRLQAVQEVKGIKRNQVINQIVQGPIREYAQAEALKDALSWVSSRLSLYLAKPILNLPEPLDQPDRTGSLTLIDSKSIPQITAQLGQYIDAESRHAFQQLLDGQAVLRPVLIATQFSRFIHAFGQLVDEGMIHESKSQVRDWLLKHFVQLKAGHQQPLKPNTVWDYLSKKAKKPLNPIQITPKTDPLEG